MKDSKYFRVVRRASDSDYSIEAYKELLAQWREQIELYQPGYQLVDYLDFYKPVPPDMQRWINENLLAPAFKAGLRRVAFIISSDYNAQVSLEQTMFADEGRKFIINFFGNEKEGEKWLFEDWKQKI